MLKFFKKKNLISYSPKRDKRFFLLKQKINQKRLRKEWNSANHFYSLNLLRKELINKLKIRLLESSPSTFRIWKRNVIKHKSRRYLKSNKNLKKIFCTKRYNGNKFRLPESLEKVFHHSLIIIIKKNNVFCTFSLLEKNNKTKFACSSGTYKLKVTRKTLRYTYDIVLKKFLSKIKKKYYRVEDIKQLKEKFKRKRTKIQKKNKKWNKKFKLPIRKKKGLIVTIISTKRFKKKLIKSIKQNFKKIPLLLKVLDKKIFNGCRAPKGVRKKRRRLRLYK